MQIVPVQQIVLSQEETALVKAMLHLIKEGSLAQAELCIHGQVVGAPHLVLETMSRDPVQLRLSFKTVKSVGLVIDPPSMTYLARLGMSEEGTPLVLESTKGYVVYLPNEVED